MHSSLSLKNVIVLTTLHYDLITSSRLKIKLWEMGHLIFQGSPLSFGYESILNHSFRIFSLQKRVQSLGRLFFHFSKSKYKSTNTKKAGFRNDCVLGLEPRVGYNTTGQPHAPPPRIDARCALVPSPRRSATTSPALGVFIRTLLQPDSGRTAV